MEFYKVKGWKEVRKMDLSGMNFIEIGGRVSKVIIPIVGTSGDFVNIYNTEHGLVLERTEENTDNRCLVFVDDYFDCSPIGKSMELVMGELSTEEKEYLLVLNDGDEFEVTYEDDDRIYYRWIDGKLIGEDELERKARFAVESFQRGECKKL